MSINEPRPIRDAADWGVVIQSVPSKHKKDIVKRLVEIFELDKRDAEQILSSVPLILVDNVSLELAVHIKKYFQKLGAATETTNHDVIKKNCMRVHWPQAPDLSFFTKNEPGSLEASGQEKMGDSGPAESPFAGGKDISHEVKPEMPRIHKGSPFAKPEQESPPPHFPVDSTPVQEMPWNVPPVPAPFERPLAPSLSGGDSDLDRRAEELNEKLRKILEEKQVLKMQHAEAVEKVQNEFRQQLAAEKEKTGEIADAVEKTKNEFQQQLEAEKKKSSEIAKNYEDLQKESLEQQNALIREGEALRAKAAALGEKVCELETNLARKTSEIEQLDQQKNETKLQFEAAVSETQRALSSLRNREQESLKKIEELERSVQQMTESLRYRDSVLAQFEQQISELADATFPQKTGSAESQS